MLNKLKILLFSFLFLTLPALCNQGFVTVSVSDDDFGNDMYTPGLPLLFKEISKSLSGEPVEIQGFNSSMADILNDVEMPQGRISERFFYKTIVRKAPKFRKKIKNEIYEKFREKTAVVDFVKWRPARENELVLYTLFKKDIELLRPFEALPNSSFNSSKSVKYFGVKKDMRDYKSVFVPLFYLNKDDFAVMLKAKNGDEIYLYRTDSDEPVDIVWDEMNFKLEAERTEFHSEDRFRAPYVIVKQNILYPELDNRRIKKSPFVIHKIFETVDFTLDGHGAKRNEFGAPPVLNGYYPSNRNFVFNKTFCIFATEKGKEEPYFMLRIKDARYLVK